MVNKQYRSWLFFSILEDRFINKLRSLRPDVVVVDLEDSVPFSLKGKARDKIGEISFDTDAFLTIRINNITSHFGKEDLKKSLKKGFTNIVHPKTSSSLEITTIENIISETLPREKAIKVQLIPIIETVEGVENIDTILNSSKLIKFVMFGSIDYLADLGFDYVNFLQYHPILANIALTISIACHKRKVFFIDCANTSFRSENDLINFKSECLFSKSIGAKGKIAIHPNHIDIINEVFDESLKIQLLITETKDLIQTFKKSKKSILNFNEIIVGPPFIKKTLNLLDDYLRLYPELEVQLEQLKSELNQLLLI